LASSLVIISENLSYILQLCGHCVDTFVLVTFLLFVDSLRLARLNEEMRESDYGVQG